MPRLMSVTLTEQAVVDRRKTVTRRLGWLHAKVGDEIDLCRKVMGRRRADGTVEPLVRLARVRIIDVRREPLNAITDDDVPREGMTEADWSASGWTPAEWFVSFFLRHMKGTPSTEVTRIEWEYVS